MILPTHSCTFSFGAAFINAYANSHIVDKQAVGYFSAIVVGSGFFASTFFGAINNRTRTPKNVPMLIGSLAFGFFALSFVVASDDKIQYDKAWLFWMYIAFGIGRGVWESTMKAVFADFFGNHAGCARFTPFHACTH